jgi:hypothetical protein
MKKIKVHQMTSPRTGNPIANQFEIYTDKGVYFQSYRSIIAFKPHKGKTQLDKNYWDYSRTTSKYRNEFLNEGIQETREKIKSKEYKLLNLN